MLDFGWRRHTPVILQIEAIECGLACLAMVAGYHGHRIDLATLRRRQPVSLRGSTLADLSVVAGRMELTPRAVRAPLDDLDKLRLPAILHWDFNHFVVLTRLRGDRVTIHDPARGARTLPLSELSRHYTGVALELSPTQSFAPRVERQRIGLRRLVGSTRDFVPALVQLFALAAALELFALAMPFYMQLTVDDALVSTDRDLVTVLGLGFLLLVAIQTATAAMRSWILMVLGNTLNLRMVSQLFRHLLRLPMVWFERRHLGDIASRFESLAVIQRTLTTSFLEGLVDGAMSLTTLCAMCLYSPRLAAVVVAAAAGYAGIRRGLYRPVRVAQDEQIAHAARQQSNFLESVRAMQTLKLFNAEPQRRAVFQNLVTETFNAAIRAQRYGIVFRASNGMLFGAENVAVVWLGALQVLDGSLSVGMLFAFVAFKQQFIARAASLVEKCVELGMLGLHSERVADIALTPAEAQEAIDPVDVRAISPAIELRDVSFRYGEREPLVLNRVNLRIEAGESVALVGASGCGKTTLVKVILGLLPPTGGEVLLGGVPIHRLGPSYRDLIGTVMQDDQLLAGSLADNISLFDPRPDPARIEQCARFASVHADIAAMPMGYGTLIGDMGTVLSGGQKQRVLLARALYRNPRILVLDEATSHLDVGRERQVNQAIAGLALTRIIVAHRPETIASADRVVVLGHSHPAAVEPRAGRPDQTSEPDEARVPALS